MNNRSLSHHGILGQKWGKKAGPPYPLDASDHTASEKKAGYRKSMKAMTDDELSKSISDLQKAQRRTVLETEYLKILKDNPKVVEKGNKEVSRILKSSGKEAFKLVSSSVIDKFLKDNFPELVKKKEKNKEDDNDEDEDDEDDE